MAGSLNTPQLGLLAGSQAGSASQLTTDQYEISANLQEVPIEVRQGFAAPAEDMQSNPHPPKYEQLDE
jgi:hypothetical protein